MVRSADFDRMYRDAGAALYQGREDGKKPRSHRSNCLRYHHRTDDLFLVSGHSRRR